MSPRRLPVSPLTPAAFAPFGDVIEAAGEHFPINEGFALRYHDLVQVDVGDAGGRPCVSVFVARRRSLPLRIRILERHPLSSQAFVPLQDGPYLVVVAPDDEPEAPQAFLAKGQGVNYHKGTWHHPLIALADGDRFLVIDRAGPGDNCEEVFLDDPPVIEALP